MKQFQSGDIQKISVLKWSIRRHRKYLLRHMTPRKLLNVAKCVFEMETQRPTLRSFPFYLRVNVSSLCNLSCPNCLVHRQNEREREAGLKTALMSFELFKKALADFIPYLLKVNLYDEGEPLLNREICKMAAWLSQHNVGSCISSNFSLKLSDERLTELATCGLEHLIVALDGSSQESYGRYRVGGDLNLVLSNLKRLMEIRKRTPASKLDVEMQFIEFDHNRHEQAAVFQLAQALGVPRFTVIQGSSVHGWDGTDFRGSAEERRQLGCYGLWVSSHINNDGSLFACDYGEDHGFPMLGWAWDFASSKLRNHPQVVDLRSSFKDASKPLDTVCTRCSIYKNKGKQNRQATL